MNYYNVDINKLIAMYNQYLADEGWLLSEGEIEETPYKAAPFNQTLLDKDHLNLCAINEKVGIHSNAALLSKMAWVNLKEVQNSIMNKIEIS